MAVRSLGKGIVRFCRSQGLRERTQGKRLQPVVLPELQGKGLAGKEAFLLKSDFVTFVATKVKEAQRQLS